MRGIIFVKKRGRNLKIVYIGLFFVLFLLIAITIRYLVSFLLGDNTESLNYQINV